MDLDGWCAKDSVEPTIQIPFGSIHEVRQTIDGLSHWVCQIMDNERLFVDTSLVPSLRALLNQWITAFESWEIPPGRTKSHEVKIALHCSRYSLLAQIILDAFPFETETVYDRFTPQFFKILKLMKTFLAAGGTREDFAAMKEPVIVFSLGIIPPLFFIGTKSRDHIVRVEALELSNNKRCRKFLE